MSNQTTVNLTIKIEGKPSQKRLDEIADNVAGYLLAEYQSVASVELAKDNGDD